MLERSNVPKTATRSEVRDLRVALCAWTAWRFTIVASTSVDWVDGVLRFFDANNYYKKPW